MRIMTKMWMVMMVVSGVGPASGSNKKHNGVEHEALCTLLKVAVAKWGDGGTTLSLPLRTALAKTIFGKESGESNVDSLKEQFPSDYDEVIEDSDSRNFACGQPYNDPTTYHNIRQVLRSGQSATHDLVCLCTVGEAGLPLNESETHDTLCGKSKEDLGVGTDKAGWSYKPTEGTAQIKATWFNVTAKCLDVGAGPPGDLKQALEEFLRKLVHKPGTWYKSRYQLGEGTPGDEHACSGSFARGACVLYYNSTSTKNPMPWWKDLEEALVQDEQFQVRQRREEEENRRKQELMQREELPKAEAVKSKPLTSNRANQHQKNNITDRIRHLNMTGSTPTPQPLLLFGAAILII